VAFYAVLPETHANQLVDYPEWLHVKQRSAEDRNQQQQEQKELQQSSESRNSFHQFINLARLRLYTLRVLQPRSVPAEQIAT
jgi:hypothetical protein